MESRQRRPASFLLCPPGCCAASGPFVLRATRGWKHPRSSSRDALPWRERRPARSAMFLLAFFQMDGVVMTNEANMSAPVTRDELRDELIQLEQRVDRRFEQV